MNVQLRRQNMDRKILEKLGEGVGVKSICRLFKIGKDRVRSVRAKGIEFNYLNEFGNRFGAVKIPDSPENVFPNFVDHRSLKTSEVDKLLLEKKDWIIDRITAQWSRHLRGLGPLAERFKMPTNIRDVVLEINNYLRQSNVLT